VPGAAHLVHGTVDLDVNIVAEAERAQVGGEVDVSLLAEPTREGITRAGPQSVTGRHPDGPLLHTCRSTHKEMPYFWLLAAQYHPYSTPA